MFRSTLRIQKTLLLSVLVAATPLAAQSDLGAQQQHDDVRSGFHFSIGAGGGAAGIMCEGCDFALEDSVNGFSGVLRLGGAVSPHVVLAAEGMGWVKNEAPLERRIAAASVVALLYPSTTGGFFFKAGVGYLRAVVEDDFGWVASDGIAPQAGIGIDIPLGGGVALTPYVNAIMSTNSATEALGYNLPVALDPFVLQAGFALTTR